MSKVAIAPVFKIHKEHYDAFLERTRQQQSDCLEKEPGCLYFDILVDPQDGETVMLYEVYSDQAALDKHRTYPHLLSYRADTEPMIKSLDMGTFKVI